MPRSTANRAQGRRRRWIVATSHVDAIRKATSLGMPLIRASSRGTRHHWLRRIDQYRRTEVQTPCTHGPLSDPSLSSNEPRRARTVTVAAQTSAQIHYRRDAGPGRRLISVFDRSTLVAIWRPSIGSWTVKYLCRSRSTTSPEHPAKGPVRIRTE